MHIKVTSQGKGEIEVKRLYLDGLKIEYTCPKCGYKGIWDNYFSYPKINETEELGMCCYECWHNWTETIKLNVSVEVL